MARIVQWREGMHPRTQHWQWLASCALFGAILLALVIAAILQDPLGASVLP